MMWCRAVFFDAGDTLLYIPVRWPARLAAALQDFGHPVQEAEVHEAREQAQLPPWPRTLEEEQAFWPAAYAVVLNDLGLQAPYPPMDELHRRVWWVHHAYLFDDTIPTLESLRSLGLRLGLISNALPSMAAALERLNVLRYFDVVTISDVLGVLKPDLRIFEHALRSAETAATETIFVDDVHENVEAATRLGMRSFLLDRNDRHPQATVPVIRGLGELLGIVKDART